MQKVRLMAQAPGGGLDFVVTGRVPVSDFPAQVLLWGFRVFRYHARFSGEDVYIETGAVALVEVDQ